MTDSNHSCSKLEKLQGQVDSVAVQYFKGVELQGLPHKIRRFTRYSPWSV